MRLLHRLVGVAAAAAALALSACAVGPDYHRPGAEVPAAWAGPIPWREAQPLDAELKGRWWTAFENSELDALVEQALAGNQNLRVAAARLDEARAQVTISQSALYPHLALNADPTRAKISANRPLAAYSSANVSTVQNDFVLDATVSYEVDLFGRVRRDIEASRAARDQSQADYENARLVLIAQVASDYFTVRELDAESAVVRASIDAQQHSLDIIAARHELGFANGLDLAQQEALLAASRTQLELLQNQRAQNEHALATLLAVPAPSFALSVCAPAAWIVPTVPVGLPSDILQRRPDVASAERAMAAANARIGVAKAAYFPTLELLPTAGWESNALASLLELPSRMWSLGAAATGTVFNGGATGGVVLSASADYTAAVAQYRQTILTAMEEVENGIIGLARLSRAEIESAASVSSAQRALDIANDRYTGGVDTFLDVFTAQQALLADQRQTVQIEGERMLAAVYLVKALGGGWQASPTTR
jgi:NodT family efflux transporter outer membrane factor (OMF) lipoprotein